MSVEAIDTSLKHLQETPAKLPLSVYQPQGCGICPKVGVKLVRRDFGGGGGVWRGEGQEYASYSSALAPYPPTQRYSPPSFRALFSLLPRGVAL